MSPSSATRRAICSSWWNAYCTALSIVIPSNGNKFIFLLQISAKKEDPTQKVWRICLILCTKLPPTGHSPMVNCKRGFAALLRQTIQAAAVHGQAIIFRAKTNSSVVSAGQAAKGRCLFLCCVRYCAQAYCSIGMAQHIYSDAACVLNVCIIAAPVRQKDIPFRSIETAFDMRQHFTIFVLTMQRSKMKKIFQDITLLLFGVIYVKIGYKSSPAAPADAMTAIGFGFFVLSQQRQAPNSSADIRLISVICTGKAFPSKMERQKIDRPAEAIIDTTAGLRPCMTPCSIAISRYL